jgi:hypothetical protein
MRGRSYQAVWLLLISSAVGLAWSAECHASKLSKRIFADIAGAYSWGTYSTPGQLDNAHAGMGVLGRVGYRLPMGLGFAAAFAVTFPQITVPGTLEEAAYRAEAFGLQASYQWKPRLEAVMHYSPVARLLHFDDSSANPAVGPTTEVSREISYSGHSYGAGMRLYLTSPGELAKVSLAFLYSREAYSRASVRTSIRTSPSSTAYAPQSSTSESKDEIVHGNTYQMGVTIGL